MIVLLRNPGLLLFFYYLQKWRRKISSKERKWEDSFSNPDQTVIMWPEQAPDHIDILTTLYKSQHDDQYDDKEWTIVVEEVTSKGRRKPIAAVPLNMRLFIMEHPDQKSELKLKLRPLTSQLKQCNLVLLLSSHLLKEGFKDDVSLASTGSHAERSSREQSVCDVANSAQAEEHAEAKQELVQIASTIQKQTWSTDSNDRAEVDIKRTTEKVQVQSVVETPSKPVVTTQIAKSEKAVEDSKPAQTQKSELDSSSGSVSVGVIRPHWRLSAQEKSASKEQDGSPTKPSTEAFFK
ncbi:hypothetical protein OESDEN_15802, partial [Oesophagostomum dentatum]